MSKSKNRKIDTFIKEYGEVTILERLVAYFDDLYEEGVVRPQHEQETIMSNLLYLGERIGSGR